MTDRRCRTYADVHERPLDVEALRRRVADPRAGAVVVFVGAVRDHDEGRVVQALRYEAHPSAAERLRAVVEESARRPGLCAVAAEHRVGDLQVGEAAVVVAVSGAHRTEAFAECAALMDRLKASVPMWKRQTLIGGAQEWVGIP